MLVCSFFIESSTKFIKVSGNKDNRKGWNGTWELLGPEKINCSLT